MSISTIIDEIIQKQRECLRKGFFLETVFVNPVDLTSILIDERFLEISHYSQATIPKGEIGKFLGISIIVSNHVPIHKLLYTVRMGNYRSVQGWTGEPEDSNVNPTRRDNKNGNGSC